MMHSRSGLPKFLEVTLELTLELTLVVTPDSYLSDVTPPPVFKRPEAELHTSDVASEF